MYGMLVDGDDRRKWVRRKSAPAEGQLIRGKQNISIAFPPALFAQIKAEALQTGRSFGAVVRDLCDASIDGIE